MLSFFVEAIMHRQKRILPIFLMLAAILTAHSTLYANPSKIVYLRSAEPDIRRGHASWYSKQDSGIKKHTANNEVFDDSGLTAAMWDVPFNQMVRVTNLENGKFVVVRVNDRGPHRRYVASGRIIDLSKHAFARIASLEKGLIHIELELL
jgi:rare lipoprotein A